MTSRPSGQEHSQSGGNTIAFLVSMVTHIGLLILLALWGYVGGGGGHSGIDLVGFAEVLGQDQLDNAGLDNTLDPALETMVDISEAIVPTQHEISLNVAATNPLELGSSISTTASLTSTGGARSVDKRRSIADGLSSEALGRGASFFGSYALGNRFVYVVDSSRSMKGERWSKARDKLLESLKSLSSEQQFFVICFDSQTSLMFNVDPSAVEFKRVNPVIIERVGRWLRSKSLGPATMPAEALRIALNMKPDAIFVLSDGELQDNSIGMMRTLNALPNVEKPIPVHAIHLISDQGMNTLQQLATENGGTFRHVSN